MHKKNILHTQIQYKLIEELQATSESLRDEIKQKKELSEELDACKEKLDDQMQEKTFELQLKNEYLKKEILDRKLIEANIVGLNNCFMGFGGSTSDNIKRIVSTAGTLLKGTAALYSKVINNQLVISSDWMAPPDIKRSDDPLGHICYDIITKSGGAVITLSDLQKSEYYASDLSVRKYGIQTYIGIGVKDENKIVASLCIVYTDEKEFSKYDEKLIALLAKFIELEEIKEKSNKRVTDYYKDLSLVNRRINLLSSFKISNYSNLTDIYDYITSSALNFSDTNKCLLYGKKNGENTLYSSQGINSAEVTYLEKDLFQKLDIINRVQKNKRVFQIDFSNEDADDKIVKLYSLSSMLAIPLITKKNSPAILILLFQNSIIPNNQELEFYNVLTHRAASALDNLPEAAA
ncbi:MAG: GAF domain-containing protein [Rickettsiales bacterium]|nr:GAF domain-containing protein [Rickettsiales bacterium]